jgi:heme/copper-type cytochrome/quinol oxidase subunit 2
MSLQRTSRLVAPIAFTRRQWLVGGFSALLLLLALVAPIPWPMPAPQERHLNLTARTWEFQPGMVKVNKGDTVVISLQSEDVVHGLYVDGYDISTQAEPGQPGELRFVADRDGAFHFRCTVPCGSLHPFMIGKLIVGPNLTWLRAVLASLIAAGSALVTFWRL